jgi:hypothetical protein
MDPRCFCCTTLLGKIFVERSSVSVMPMTCTLQHAMVYGVTTTLPNLGIANGLHVLFVHFHIGVHDLF